MFRVFLGVAVLVLLSCFVVWVFFSVFLNFSNTSFGDCALLKHQETPDVGYIPM